MKDVRATYVEKSEVSFTVPADAAENKVFDRGVYEITLPAVHAKRLARAILEALPEDPAVAW